MNTLRKNRALKLFVTAIVSVSLVFTSVFAFGDGSAYAASEGTMISNAVNVSFGQRYFKYWTKDTDHLNHYSKITVPSNGIINIKATKPFDSEGEYGRMYFTVYDASGKAIWGNNGYKAKDGILDTYDMNVGLRAGTYYMTLKPGFTVTSGLIETYYTVTHTPYAYCEMESNEGLQEATPITLNQVHLAYYGPDGSNLEQIDYWKFDLVAGRTYKVAVGNYSAFEPTTTIQHFYNTSGSREYNDISKKVDGNGMNYFIYTAPVTGTYSYKFYNYNGAQVPYTIAVYDYTKSTQTITNVKSSYVKKENSADFTIKPYAEGKISYHSSNDDVAWVGSSGKVYISGIGKTTITIKAAETETHNAATKKITVTVKPKNIAISSLKNLKNKTLQVNWKSQWNVKGYQVQYATNAKFTKNKVTKKAAKSSYTGMNIKKMKKKTYYVRIRTYAKGEDGKTYYSDWSKTKKIKIKR